MSLVEHERLPELTRQYPRSTHPADLSYPAVSRTDSDDAKTAGTLLYTRLVDGPDRNANADITLSNASCVRVSEVKAHVCMAVWIYTLAHILKPKCGLGVDKGTCALSLRLLGTKARPR